MHVYNIMYSKCYYVTHAVYIHNQLHSILSIATTYGTCHTCSYQITILVLTFCLYASLHMARMTSSVVKVTSLQ